MKDDTDHTETSDIRETRETEYSKVNVSGNKYCHDNDSKIFRSKTLKVFHSLNPCLDLHQNYGICLAKEENLFERIQH